MILFVNFNFSEKVDLIFVHVEMNPDYNNDGVAGEEGRRCLNNGQYNVSHSTPKHSLA